jgi:hypothetical protein
MSITRYTSRGEIERQLRIDAAMLRERQRTLHGGAPVNYRVLAATFQSQAETALPAHRSALYWQEAVARWAGRQRDLAHKAVKLSIAKRPETAEERAGRLRKEELRRRLGG